MSFQTFSNNFLPLNLFHCFLYLLFMNKRIKHFWFSLQMKRISIIILHQRHVFSMNSDVSISNTNWNFILCCILIQLMSHQQKSIIHVLRRKSEHNTNIAPDLNYFLKGIGLRLNSLYSFFKTLFTLARTSSLVATMYTISFRFNVNFEIFLTDW